MSKYLFLLDSGHGGCDANGVYQTSGKRMVKDGFVYYEGVNNRDNVDRILKGLELSGLEAVDIVNDWRDISLTERVNRANKLAKERKCVYISIHSDANSNGKEWNPASGIGTYIYTNGSRATQSLSKYMHSEFVCNFDGIAKDRRIKKSNFYVLRKTSMPACLLEIGFHTNKAELTKMITNDWKDRIVKAVVGACNAFELNN